MGLVITQGAVRELERFPHKVRAQLIRKAKALIIEPHPPGSKKLSSFTTVYGEPVYRQRSGDYRILYVVRSVGTVGEVIVLDIDNRKDVYRMKKKENSKADDEYRMKADDFDKAMRSALGTPAPSKPTRKRRSSKKKRKG